MNPPLFRLSFNSEFKETLDLLILKATLRGRYAELKKSLIEIEHRLLTDPVEWGDPHMRLPGMNMTVYHRIHDQLSVVYAVNHDDRIVWWTKLDPVLSHPLV